MKNKEMDSCTFKPQLVSRPLKERRNFEEFLKDQQTHEENKALKRNIMLEHESQMEEGVIHHPEINDSSRRMIENRPDAHKPVHERLYGISKTNRKINQIINDADSDLKQVSSVPGSNITKKETFAPVINQRSKEIVRDQPVQDLLYNDALRRKDMEDLRKQKLSKEQNKREKEVNESNIEYLIHKFNKEFEPTFEVIIQQSEDAPQDILNYRQLGELLFDMGFLSGSSSSESDERILLSSMWTGLGGAQNEGLNKEVIRAFLLAVEGVKITESVRAPSEEEFGQMKDGEFYPDCPKISKHFRLMYLNRIRHSKDQTKRKLMRAENEANQDCTFQPMISDNTQNLALKYRQKIAENYEGGKITVLDILTAQTNKQQWIEDTKKEIENKESEECTFHPMTNENMKVRDDETIEISGDKCNDLYQISRVKAKPKVDKSKDEYEYEKSKQECTFQPNIGKTKQRDKKPHFVNQRSIQENLDRMKRAREEREYKKKMTERGYGEPVNKPKPRKQPNKPVNYQVRNTRKPAPKATVGSARTRRKEEAKQYEAPQKSKERRGPAMKNATKATLSSQAKKRNAPSYNPSQQTKKIVKQSRVYQEQKYENNQEPEQMYDEPDQMYDQAEQEEIMQHLRQEDPIIQDQSDTPEEQFVHQEDMDMYVEQQLDRYDEPQESPEDDQKQEMEQPNDPVDDEGEDGPNPLLFVDVNLGPGRAERIVVYEGDTAEQLAEEFTTKHGLDENLKEKLVKLLENQIASLLARIDEELTSNGTENEQ